MALPVHFTTTRNISMDAIKAGKYNHYLRSNVFATNVPSYRDN